MKFGYARESTRDQNLALQLDLLKQENCQMIFHEQVSGAIAERVELGRLLEEVRKGDVLVIWRLDWRGRSLKHLVTHVYELME